MSVNAAPAGRPWWSGSQIYLLVVLVLVSVSNYMDRQIVPLLQEAIKADLKLSDTQLGMLTGFAFALFYSLGGIPIARLAERLNRVKLLTAVIAVWSVMTGLCGLAPNYAALALCRLGVGMAEGGSIPISHSLIAEKFDRRQRGLAMAIFSTGAPLAGILIPILGGWVAHVWGWRVAFLVVCLPGLFLAMLVWTTLRDARAARELDEHEKPASFRTDVGWLIRCPPFVCLFLAAAFTGMASNGMTIFLVSFLTRSHGLNLVEAGSVFGLNGIMGLIGTFVGGYLADRYAGPAGRSYPYVCGAGMAVACVFYFGALTIASLPIVFVMIAIANIGTDLKNGPAFATVQNIVPTRMRATAAAVYMLAATLIGTGFGPLIVGGFSDLFAQASFTLGDFQAMCPGGRAIEGASAALNQACHLAATEGLRHGMMVSTSLYLGAVLFFYLAGRFLQPPRDGQG